MPRTGLLVSNGADAVLERVLTKGVWSPVERFGVPTGWTAGPSDKEGAFEVAWQGEALGRVRWKLLGEHNRSNALAALGAARHAGVPAAQAIEALSRFSGVRRRMQVRGEVSGVTVYDDFAHHPTAIRTTVEGLRQRVGKARILAVLEPRSATMRRGVMKDALPESLAAADHVFVYTANVGWNPETVFARLGARASCSGDLEGLVAAIAAEAHAGDHVLVMSNGGFGGIHGKLLDRLRRPA